ncbi:PIN domain-containing protein [Myxococcota bacterium]|nr:PIN domain-containing protein [Myxococcota bacterium]MBU1382744.1 PIN domain-containing protein [Myxococcota bacterium]MBU1498278.1 PIN domain-containing protein [Myxococcota bacterium]
MAFLIDTDIIIHSLRGNKIVHNWFKEHENEPTFISVITYGELVYGAQKSKIPIKNLAAVKRIGDLIPVVDLTKDVMDIFGTLKCRLEADGNRIDDMDLMIASTAIYMNLTLVTANTRHFNRIEGLNILNPF